MRYNKYVISCLKKDKNYIVTSKCIDITSKLCMNCKYYIPHLKYHNIDDRLQYGLCTHPKFTDIDIVTGETYYEYACKMRYNIKHCGPEARYYEKESAKWIILKTIRAYISIQNIVKFITIIICIMSVMILIKALFKL